MLSHLARRSVAPRHNLPPRIIPPPTPVPRVMQMIVWHLARRLSTFRQAPQHSRHSPKALAGELFLTRISLRRKLSRQGIAGTCITNSLLESTNPGTTTELPESRRDRLVPFHTRVRPPPARARSHRGSLRSSACCAERDRRTCRFHL